MTNAEFIRRLKKARELALTRYDDEFRITSACYDAGIVWLKNAICDYGKGEHETSTWFLWTNGNTDENVRAVFDNSIRALGGEP